MKPTEHKILTTYQSSLPWFIQFALPFTHPNTALPASWDFDLLTDSLTHCHDGRMTKLHVDWPPQYLISIVVSVFYVAWALGHKPDTQFIVVNYDDGQVLDFTESFRQLIESPRYQALYPHVQIDEKRSFGNDIHLTNGGRRLGVSVGGCITGRGTDVIIIDDPSEASYARTKERENFNSWFDENIYLRLNNNPSGVIIFVMQCLQMGDLARHVFDSKRRLRALGITSIESELSKEK